MLKNNNLKLKLLITAPVQFMPELKKAMQNELRCLFAYQAGKTKTIKLLKDADAWMCSPCPAFFLGKDILKHAKKLKLLATPSTGTNHIDLKFCSQNSIKVLSLKDAPRLKNIYASSEFTFALILAVVRNLPSAFIAAKKGLWREIEVSLRGRELNGMTLGIIGYGRIGSNLARYARAFGMKILAYDPYVRIKDGYTQQKTSYSSVLKQADIVVVCVNLNEQTRGMINARWFGEMKQGTYFINTSRGEVVNDADLLKALKTGRIKAAGLDVISNEFASSQARHPLIRYAQKHDNLIITPHIAGLTVDSETKAQAYTFDLIRNYFTEEKVGG